MPQPGFVAAARRTREESVGAKFMNMLAYEEIILAVGAA
jgi:hypothetical protein